MSKDLIIEVHFILGYIRKTIESQKNINFIANDDASTAFHSRRKSILGPTSFPEDTSMPYSGLEPEPTRLHAECHIYHTGWAAITELI
ncbi:hypothetical protein TNCV_4643261 [Trichonephila clavipes]|nr:hypothetical protein TNCV_4643261 [Trichonephila clavipes]